MQIDRVRNCVHSKNIYLKVEAAESFDDVHFSNCLDCKKLLEQAVLKKEACKVYIPVQKMDAELKLALNLEIEEIFKVFEIKEISKLNKLISFYDLFNENFASLINVILSKKMLFTYVLCFLIYSILN